LIGKKIYSIDSYNTTMKDQYFPGCITNYQIYLIFSRTIETWR